MIREAIQMLVDGKSLNMDEAAQVMAEIMEGQVTPAQFGAFVTALRLKGETADEIAGMAKTMRAKAIRVNAAEPVIDIVGTGGDGMNTFNISTCAALVVAGAGLKVAKHGNRAASSRCGSADVLEALGVKLELTAEHVQKCIKEAGIGFMFAPSFHPAMKYAGPPRREIGIRTVFNILGPLTNPAFASRYLLGVAEGAIMEKMTNVLKSLGCERALVVHGEDGLDEITITAKTQVYELANGQIKKYSISPEDFDIKRASLNDIKGGTAAENAVMTRAILSGEKSPRRDAVLMNAGAALFAGGKAADIKGGIELARKSIDGGQALACLEKLVKVSSSFA